MNKTHVIIGASAAGIGAIQRIMRLAPDDTIICIAAQAETPYNTCFLADYCAGHKTYDSLSIFDCSRVHPHLQMRLGVAVDRVDPHTKRIMLSDGIVLSYDTLFIGTGSSAIMPAIPGINGCAGVFTFHTMVDCERVMAYRVQKGVARAVVVGAGLTGLEVADALAAHGVVVSVVERQDRVLKQVAGVHAATFVQAAMERARVQLHLNDSVIGVRSSNQEVIGVELASGSFITTDMIIVAVGASRNDQLARAAGVAVSGLGIVTDQHMRTSIEGIWAGGDVAQVTCSFTGDLVASCTWPDAMLQGLTAAHAMVGVPKSYLGAQRIVDSAFFGLRFQAGGASCSGPERREHTIEDNAQSSMAAILTHDRVVGYVACSVQEIPRGLKQMLASGKLPAEWANQ